MSVTLATSRNASLDSQQFCIRPLTADDSHAYRAVRQRILDIGDGQYFSDSYARERQLTESQWLEWCTEKREHCIIGTFVNNELVGVMMITQQGPSDSPLVEWEATWLDPRIRGTGIAKLAYEQVLKWSEDQGYKFAVAFIRDDNIHSQDIRRKQGFVYTYTVHNEIWADGSIGDTRAFVLDLRAATPEQRRRQTLRHLEEVVGFLNQGLHAPPKQHCNTAAPTQPERLRATFGQQTLGLTK